MTASSRHCRLVQDQSLDGAAAASQPWVDSSAPA